MSAAFLSLDLRSLPGRLLAVGDVHGRFDLLEQQLRRLRYREGHDRIILLGDLVNRGHLSHQIDRWWDELRILGNHEQIVAWHVDGTSSGLGTASHASWIDAMPRQRRRTIARRLMEAPVAIEAITPAGHRVGFVHAQVPSMPAHDWQRLQGMLKDPTDQFHQQAVLHAANTRYDWSIARQILSDERHPDHANAREQALWARTHVSLVRMGYDAPWVDGIDHVFLGHTRMDEPRTHRNCSWIDTGAYRTGRLTVVDVDRWVADAKDGTLTQ